MIEEKFKSCDFSIEGNPDKNYLQRFLYKNCGVTGCATIVSGIAINRHISDFKDYILSNNVKISTLDIVEIDKSIYNRIKKSIALVNEDFHINVIHNNIAYIPLLRRFVDADLTQSFENCALIFKILFIKMHEQYTNFNHALICTYTKRSTKEISILNVLHKITNKDWKKTTDTYQLPLINYSRGSYLCVTKYTSGRYEALVTSYRFKDSSPMVSILIKW